eukprot:2086654-Ditylum_brightwellii.AAC.1
MDTNNFVIHIDNCDLKCTSNNINHFVSPITELYGHTMKSTGGHRLKVHGEGILLWTIQDDDSAKYNIYVKGALYVPESTVFLLSPQH